MLRLLLLAVLAALLAVAAEARTPRLDYERITEFDTRLDVSPEGLLTVRERIAVVALGEKIRRGIYRDLPLVRETLLGRSAPGFEILSVERDGRDEPYRTESVSGAIRIYIGDRDVLLARGLHVYELVYTVEDQIGFFADFDEIYWNATGDGWDFLIEQARASVAPPPGAPVVQTAAYTGPRGSTEQAVAISRDAEGRVVFRATRPLSPGEGLTVAVGWPKGFVAEPGPRERLIGLLKHSRQAMMALIVLAIVVLFYLIAWRRVGRDPPPGTIVPVYAPTLPPAAMRYIRRMGYDHRCLAAALVSMAVKGHLVIDDDDGDMAIERRAGGREPLSAGETALRQALFGAAGGGRIRIGKESRGALQAAAAALKRHFDRTFDAIYFLHNRHWFLSGAALTLLGWLLVAASAPTVVEAVMMSVWLAGWSIGTGALVRTAWGHWRTTLAGGGILNGAGALLVSAFALPFIGAWAFGVFMLNQAVGPVAAGFLVIALGLNLLFYHLLKAPTAIGRTALDEIEGMERYLTVAEADRLRFHHDAPATPALFERFLPYAVALDVETVWAEHFAEVLERARQPDGAAYRPAWYRGSRFAPSDLGGLGGSIAGAVSSATAPRSSGSSGGGSSGGGGGGGGGGGW